MTESLWLDEATTALVAKMSLADIFGRFLPGDFHPPLYYLLMKYWSGIFGTSEVALRAPSLLFAALTVFLVYKMFGRIAALLLATAPLLFYYAQEARMYAITMFFVTLAFFSLVKTNKESRVGWWIIFSLSLFFLGATDYVALLILPVLRYMGRREPKKLFMSHIILIGYGVIWLPYFLKQFLGGISAASESPAWSQLLGQFSLKNVLLVPVKFLIGRIGFDNNLLYALFVGAISLIFSFLIIKGWKRAGFARIWLGIPLILAVVISFKIPILNYFRFLFVLPAFYILIAKGIENSGRYKNTFLALVLGINIICIVYYMVTPGFHREDWRGAVKAIGSSQIILPADSQKEALIYYGAGGQIAGMPSEKEIWLSRYVREVSDPSDSKRAQIEALGYNKISEHNFNGVVFWKYAHSD